MGAGLNSSAYDITPLQSNIPIAANSKILANDIIITAKLLGGDTGQIRIWFSFAVADDFQITVSKKGSIDLTGFPLKLNADGAFLILPKGYYRFDIAVSVGDLINLSCNEIITGINDFTIQLVPIAT